MEIIANSRTKAVCELLNQAFLHLNTAEEDEVDVSAVRRGLDHLRMVLDDLECRHHVSRRIYYSIQTVMSGRALVGYKCNKCGIHTTTLMPAAEALKIEYTERPA